MKLFVATRCSLVDPDLPADAPALLLEGAWDDPLAPARWSLDESLDGRFDWIDRQAESCAEQLIRHDQALWLGALDLRYHLVKLLRVPAFFDHVRPLEPGDEVELAAQLPRDADYVDLLGQIAKAAGARFLLRQIPGPPPAAPRFPPNGRFRRWLGRLADLVQPVGPACRAGHLARVVFCGNPRVLDPVARALVARGARLWWLYDRFALRSFLTWRRRGVGQLVCNSSQAAGENGDSPHLPKRVEVAGVDLAPALNRYTQERVRWHGPRQTRLLQQIEAHFQRVRPQVLVLDEDATPPARAAIAGARAVGARSLVIQHGALCCRFGFAPLAADQICVWGRSSRSQLIRWGVPAERILVTGSPYHEQLRKRIKLAARGLHGRLLLLATVPPRDERPDSLALHLTRASYAAVLRAAFDGAARTGCRELIIKLHPRAGDDPMIRAALAEHPSLSVRVVRAGRLEELLGQVDCVLSCGSSAGVDATLSGVPVIQLLSPGASDFLSREPWGLSGIARTAGELEHLLRDVLSTKAKPRPIDPNVFHNLDRSPAEAIAEEVLNPSPSNIPAPHSSFILQPSSFR